MLLEVAQVSATFQSYINKYLAEKLDIFYIGYLDNILIYTEEKRGKHKTTVR